MNKDIRIFLKGKAKEEYNNLKHRKDKESKSILNSFERIKDILKENPQFGNPINKKLFPVEFKKMGIKNLYRIELSNYWRMLYTLEGNEVDVLLFILSLSDHKGYNKLFGYRS